MSRSPQSFPKSERITNKSDIDSLFKDGRSFTCFPLKIIHQYRSELTTNKVLISVPKRNFPRAVDRNLLKRRVREAYRKHKPILGQSSGKKYLIAYIYQSREIFDYQIIEEKLIDSLHRLEREDAK